MKNYIIIILLFVSCDNHSKTMMLSNFNVIIKSNTYTINIKNKTYTRFYTNHEKEVKFNLSHEEIRSIFTIVSNDGLLDINNNYDPWKYCDKLPISTVNVYIENGEIQKKITTKNCIYLYSGKIKKINYLIGFIQNLVLAKKEVKNMPLSNIETD